MRKVKFIVLAVVMAVLVATCRHELPPPLNTTGGPPPVISGSCNPDSVYFANTILPLISSNCAMSGCHDPGSHKEGLVLNNYSGIMRLVVPGNAGGSKLFKVITTTNPGDVMPPPPHSRLSTANIAAIQKWINQGAKNNQCSPPCDTALFTYSGAISPMFNTYCKGCHNPSSLGGGVDLSSYATVKAIASTGRLMGSIKHSPGYIPMPQGGNKLQDCQVREVEKWIQSGMPNN